MSTDSQDHEKKSEEKKSIMRPAGPNAWFLIASADRDQCHLSDESVRNAYCGFLFLLQRTASRRQRQIRPIRGTGRHGAVQETSRRPLRAGQEGGAEETGDQGWQTSGD